MTETRYLLAESLSYVRNIGGMEGEAKTVMQREVAYDAERGLMIGRERGADLYMTISFS